MGEMIAILVTLLLIGGYLAWHHKRQANKRQIKNV